MFGKQNNEFTRFGMFKFMEMEIIVIEGYGYGEAYQKLTMAASSFRKRTASEYGLSRRCIGPFGKD